MPGRLKILILGGTQLSGPFLVRGLVAAGHDVTLFHRGHHRGNVPAHVGEIIAPAEAGPPSDRYHLRTFVDEFRRARPDVVVHMIAFTREDAEAFVGVFKGLTGRVVVPSSSDVYRSMGIINRTEPGPPIPVPIDENGPLRQRLSVHGSSYEKLGVELVVLNEPALPACVLRYPAVYGPGSYRGQEWIKRMLDQRPAIIVGKGEATFRFSHGYCEDVGAATALAVTNDRSAGRIYNVGEKHVPTQRQRLEVMARLSNWNGEVVEVEDEIVPGGDGFPYHGQDWLLDTTRIRQELGFAEVADHEQSVLKTFKWQMENPNPSIDAKRFNYAAEDVVIAKARLPRGGRQAV